MLRVMTLNLNYYGDKHGDWPTRRELIGHRIRDAKPDIVALQAVRKDAAQYGGADQIEQLANYLADYQYAVFEAAVTRDDGSQDGSGFLARIPIQHMRSEPLTLRRGLDDANQRVLLHVRIDLPDEPLHLFNAHFSWVVEQAVSNVREAVAIAGAVEELALLVGDLNQPPDSEPMAKLRALGWVDAWSRLQPSHDGFTFEAPQPTTRLDYAWANSRLAHKLSHVEIIAGYPTETGADLSDHLGVMVTLDLEKLPPR